MPQANNLHYVTSNKYKFEKAKEFFNIFAPKINLYQLDLEFIEIQTEDPISIAASKAQQAFKKIQSPLLVDDSGFYFDRYDEFPGTMTGQVAKGLDIDGVLKLFEDGDTGYLRVVMVYIWDNDKCKVFDFRTNGTLIKPNNYKKIPGNLFLQLLVPFGYKDSLYDLNSKPERFEANPRNKALSEFLLFYEKTKNHGI